MIRGQAHPDWPSDTLFFISVIKSYRFELDPNSKLMNKHNVYDQYAKAIK